MKQTGLMVDIDCKLSVSRDTAECCLKLVEMFVNANKQFGVVSFDKDDGSKVFCLVDSSIVVTEP